MATSMVILLSILWLADKHLENGGKIPQLSAVLRRFRSGGTPRTDP